MGYKAQSLLGYQAEVVTDSEYGNARIIEIGTKRLRKAIERKYIVVVAGFQGHDIKGNITTLGRGGSDTSAVAIAAALNADVCEIYTDVDGIYTADPNICPKARKLKFITTTRCSTWPAWAPRFCRSARSVSPKKYNIPVHVRSSFNEEEGTMVVNEDSGMEQLVVSSVTHDKKQARVTLTKVPDQPGIAAKIFSPISEAGIVVDMIIQNTRKGGKTDMTFTVPKGISNAPWRSPEGGQGSGPRRSWVTPTSPWCRLSGLA
jgi:aspartate kinase